MSAPPDTLKRRDAAGLVVYHLDRRARDLMVQETLLRDLWAVGPDIFTTSAGEAAFPKRDDPDDPSRKFVRHVLGAVSEYEHAMIAARLRAGRRRKVDTGGYAYGAPPFGTRADRGRLVEDADELTLSDAVRELRAAGHSYRQVAAALDAEGLRPRRRERWQNAVVRRIALRR